MNPWRCLGKVLRITLLNRELRWDNWSIEYEAYPKHAKIIAKDYGLNGCSQGPDCSIDEETNGEF
jgi:hypothetical protein